MPVLALFIVGLVMLLAAPVFAADSRQLLDQAVQRYKRGDLREALLLLRDAHIARRGDPLHGPALRQHVATIYLYEGLCQALIRRPAEARRSFEQALDHDPTLRLDPDRFKPAVVKLFEEVKAYRLSSTLAVSADVSAQVWIDGRDAGPVPLRLNLAPGRHQLEVRGAGRRQRVVVELMAGESRRLAVPLLPAGAASRPAPPPPPSEPRRIWTWVSAAGSLAFLAAGVAVHLSAASTYGELERSYAELLAAGDLGRIEELRGSVHRQDIAASVMFGLSGACAASAVVLFFVESRAGSRAPDHEHRAGRPRVRPILGGIAGLQVDLRF